MEYAWIRNWCGCNLVVGLSSIIGGCTADTEEVPISLQAMGAPIDSIAVTGESYQTDQDRNRSDNWLTLPESVRDTAPVLSVTAKGSGCPRGTGAARLSADLRTLTISLSALEAAVHRNITRAVRNCHLTIALRDTENVSYTVTELSSTGYVYLQPGQEGRSQLAYSFQGSRARREAQTEFIGPFDDAFTQLVPQTTLPLSSRCGPDLALNVGTSVGIENGGDADGYINLCALDANCDVHLRLKLDWGSCQN